MNLVTACLSKLQPVFNFEAMPHFTMLLASQLGGRFPHRQEGSRIGMVPRGNRMGLLFPKSSGHEVNHRNVPNAGNIS